MSENAILDLVQRSNFVFAGTVQSLDRSSLRVLPSRPGLAIVHFGRGFRVDKMLGTLDGRPITVRLAQEGAGAGAVRPKQQLVFFATHWVHGEQIAVSEISRLPADRKTEDEVVRAVASLPELHLSQRIASAVLIVHGTVTEIARATDIPRTSSEHDPYWMRALIQVKEVLKGQADASARRGKARRVQATLLFPGTGDIAFRRAPRPAKGQVAVFLLHELTGQEPKGAHIAPDPADIQPPSALGTIRRLLGGRAARPPG